MDKSDSVEETFKQYEDELLLLFKNCDQRKTGHLTALEFNDLLNVLQLDKSYKDQLLTTLSSNATVTFEQFKESLLSIIYSSSSEVKREISPEREVSPKLVVGAKKYGRRSKPESIEEELNGSIAQANNDIEHLENKTDISTSKNNMSHAEDDFSRLSEMHCAQTSLDEMFPQLSKRGSRDSPLGLILPEVHGLVDNNIKAGFIHYDTLQELWESQGVNNASSLLRLLGIEPGTETSIEQLSLLLEELRQTDATNTQVLIGSLCLAQLQNNLIKTHLEQLMFERDKLRSDVSSANKRASLIAAEIDENYSRIENSVQSQLRLAEASHTEEVRRLSAALVAEREKLSAVTGEYKREMEKCHETIGALTSQMADKQKHHDKLASDYKALQEESSLLERNFTLSKEQAQEIQLLKRKLQYLQSSNESLLEFETVVSELRAENSLLRDRNDEMGVELENALRKCRQSCDSGAAACKRRTEDDTEDCSSSSGGKLRKFNTRQDVSMSGLSTSPLSNASASPLSSKNLSAFYEESRNLQLELPVSESPLPEDIEEDEHNFVTFIKRRSPLNSDSIELQFSTFQNEIQKLLSEKRLADEENQKLKQENVTLKKQLSQIEKSEVPNVPDEVDGKMNASQTPGGLNLKSFAFDISFDSLTTSPKARNKLKKSNMACVLNNNNDVTMNTDEADDGDDQFRTMTIHRAIDDVPEENGIVDNGGELSRTLPTAEETSVNESGVADVLGCEVDSLNVPDEEMCLEKRDEPLSSTRETVTAVGSCENKNTKADVSTSEKITMTDSSENQEPTSKSVDGIITVINKPDSTDDDGDIKQWLNGVKNNSTKWTRETLEECLKQPHPLWKLATLEAFLNEREELLNKCFYLETYVEKYETMKAEKAEAEEKCQDLTNCLEQMKVEFERLEDYWTGKMDDERKLFEQEQAQSSEKYIELELKINEYAELFSKADEDADMIQQSSLGFKAKLPTIDETEMYERQVVELEEEMEDMKERMREKDDVIRELRQTLRQIESSNSTALTFSPIQTSQPLPDISIQDTSPPVTSTKPLVTTSTETLDIAPSLRVNESVPEVVSSPLESVRASSDPVTKQPELAQPIVSRDSSQLVLFNSNRNDWSSSPPTPSVASSALDVPTDHEQNKDCSVPPTIKQYIDCSVLDTGNATIKQYIDCSVPPATKQYRDCSVQTVPLTKSLDSAAVQTEMFLDEIDSLASKLDPDRISHYERVLNNQISSPTSASETPKLHKKMRRHKKNHQRSNQVNESRNPDLSVGDDDSLALELRLQRQNLSRLASSDLLVKDLYVRNCANMARIHNLERELLLERSKNHKTLSC